MGTYTHIRTERRLGPDLSKTFQSFICGSDIDGKDCELHQVESILKLDLSSFLITNYSGMWEVSEFDFIQDEKERKAMIEAQLQEDAKWADRVEFLKMIEALLKAIREKKLVCIKYNQDWWQGYFENKVTEHDDSFKKDLLIIRDFLNDSEDHEGNVAFYSE
ncbi:MAG: hypothetical protein WBG46_02495 [Nonlabens sp.]